SLSDINPLSNKMGRSPLEPQMIIPMRLLYSAIYVVSSALFAKALRKTKVILFSVAVLMASLALLASINPARRFAGNSSAPRREHRPATAGGTDLLQFTSGGHILGFSAGGLYVASG